VRERFFTPRLRFKTYDEMNAWLTDKCIAYAKAHRHPELTDQTIWEAPSYLVRDKDGVYGHETRTHLGLGKDAPSRISDLRAQCRGREYRRPRCVGVEAIMSNP
jgi:hypothetical protein